MYEGDFNVLLRRAGRRHRRRGTPTLLHLTRFGLMHVAHTVVLSSKDSTSTSIYPLSSVLDLAGPLDLIMP